MSMMEQHIGHRCVITRWPNQRATARCEDCGVAVSTGTTIPHGKEAPVDWPQVITGTLRDRPPVGLYILSDESPSWHPRGTPRVLNGTGPVPRTTGH